MSPVRVMVNHGRRGAREITGYFDVLPRRGERVVIEGRGHLVEDVHHLMFEVGEGNIIGGQRPVVFIKTGRMV